MCMGIVKACSIQMHINQFVYINFNLDSLHELHCRNSSTTDRIANNLITVDVIANWKSRHKTTSL